MNAPIQANRAGVVRLHPLVSLLRRAFGSEPTVAVLKMRRCQDVPRFLAKFDAIQKRTSKSKLILGTLKQANNTLID